MVTLKTIAEDLDVSVSLVSKVLNKRMGTSGVNPKTQEMIRERARTLKYRPHFSASSLQSGRQGVLGVLVHRLGAVGSSVVESLLRGIANGLAEDRRRMWLMFYQDDEEFDRYLPFLQTSAIDGLILAGIRHDGLRDQLVEISHSRLPIVTVHEYELDKSIPNAGMDQAKMSQLSVEHLLEQGCKRLLMVGPKETERHLGFVNACQAHGLKRDVDFKVCLTQNYEYESGGAAEKFFAPSPEFDGVVALSDQLALNVINHLVRQGIHVPQQVKVIGMDDSPACGSAIVPLTSVSEKYEERGRHSVNMINDMFQGKPVESCWFNPEIKRQAST